MPQLRQCWRICRDSSLLPVPSSGLTLLLKISHVSSCFGFLELGSSSRFLWNKLFMDSWVWVPSVPMEYWKLSELKMCLPDLKNQTFSIPIFLSNFSPVSIPFLKAKHPIFTKLAAFYNNLPKIHPIKVIWVPSSLMNPSHCYTKFCEKVPQKAGTYTYAMSMRDPLERFRYYKSTCRCIWVHKNQVTGSHQIWNLGNGVADI